MDKEHANSRKDSLILEVGDVVKYHQPNSRPLMAIIVRSCNEGHTIEDNCDFVIHQIEITKPTAVFRKELTFVCKVDKTRILALQKAFDSMK